jgi:hypothetical protein
LQWLKQNASFSDDGIGVFACPGAVVDAVIGEEFDVLGEVACCFDVGTFGVA